MLKNLNDLQVLVTVAREGSFTRAAAHLGLSQSALSHTVSGLEARLGVRLLTRTTRKVALTDAGQRLFDTVAPRFDEIAGEVAALSDLRDKPAGPPAPPPPPGDWGEKKGELTPSRPPTLPRPAISASGNVSA